MPNDQRQFVYFIAVICRSNLKFSAVTSTKGKHQIPKNEISAAETFSKMIDQVTMKLNDCFFEKILRQSTVQFLFEQKKALLCGDFV